MPWYLWLAVALGSLAGVGAVMFARRLDDRAERQPRPEPDVRDKGIYAGRTCCPTLPNGAHTGVCKNAIVMCGEERFWVNDLPGRRAALR